LEFIYNKHSFKRNNSSILNRQSVTHLRNNCDKKQSKMKVEQYRPNFFSGFKKSTSHFNTTKELLNIHWIKNFKENPNFHRFSISRDERDVPQHKLMAEYEKGLEWWVVAFIRDEDISAINDLPDWSAKYKDKANTV